MAGNRDIRAGRAYVELALKNGITKSLQNAKKQLESFGKSAVAIGRSMITFGSVAAAPFAFATKTFIQFDDAMRAVQGVTQASEADFTALTKRAKELGASTSFTAVQVASLMIELGRAGFDPKQIEKMTASVLSLARATGTDATLSAEILGTTIQQFRLKAEDAARVADALTATANKSATSVDGLGESLSYVGPVAADANYSLEQTLAILGALGNVGIKGSEAGTAMRRLLTLTAAEAKKLQGIFGVAFTDAAGNARPLIDVLSEVNEKTKNLPTALRAAKFNEAFGLLGITSASAIGKSIGSIKELQAELEKAAGTAAETAKKMDSGLGGAFRRMLSAIEGVQIAIGEAIAPVLSEFAAKVEFAAQAVIKFVNENKAFVVGAAAVVAGVIGAGAALVTIGLAAQAAAFAIGGLLVVWGGIVTAVGAVLSPVGVLAIALVSGVQSWMKWTESGQAAAATIQSAFAAIGKTVNDTWAGITTAVGSGNLQLAAEIAISGFDIAWMQATNNFVDMWRGSVTEIAKVFVNLWAGVQSGWIEAVAFMKQTWLSFQGLLDKANIFYQADQDKTANKWFNEQTIAANDAEQSAINKQQASIARKEDFLKSNPRQRELAIQVKADKERLAERQRRLDIARKAERTEAQIEEFNKGIDERAAKQIAGQSVDSSSESKKIEDARKNAQRQIESDESNMILSLEADRKRKREAAEKRLRDAQGKLRSSKNEAEVEALFRDAVSGIGGKSAETAAATNANSPLLTKSMLSGGGGTFDANALLGMGSTGIGEKIVDVLKKSDVNRTKEYKGMIDAFKHANPAWR